MIASLSTWWWNNNNDFEFGIGLLLTIMVKYKSKLVRGLSTNKSKRKNSAPLKNSTTGNHINFHPQVMISNVMISHKDSKRNHQERCESQTKEYVETFFRNKVVVSGRRRT